MLTHKEKKILRYALSFFHVNISSDTVDDLAQELGVKWNEDEIAKKVEDIAEELGIPIV